MNEIPALRVAVTNKCNMNCLYCPKDGDSYLLEGASLNLDQIIRIVTIANSVGINSFSLTGGEPLVVPEITFPLAKKISQFKNLHYLKLNTNGTFLKKYINDIINSGFGEVKVSLDILTPNSIQNLSHYQNNVKQIVDGIKESIKHQLPVRLQSVITKQNLPELDKIINFCTDISVDLKLFDLTYYKDAISTNKIYWQKNYISLEHVNSLLEEKFGKPQIVHAVGGFGHPNKVFTTAKNTKIMIRDTEVSAFYTEKCKKCDNYMCQDGLCTLTLSADARLKLCRPRGINLGLNLANKNGTLKTDKQIAAIFKKAIHLFKTATETKRSFSDLNLPPLV